MRRPEALWTREFPKIRTKYKPQSQRNGTQAVPYGRVYFTVHKIFTRVVVVPMLQIAVADAVTLVYNHTRGERTMLFPCCTFSAQSPLSKEVAAQRILDPAYGDGIQQGKIDAGQNRKDDDHPCDGV